jgi:predicted MPP superfamily phosphohydrolase
MKLKAGSVSGLVLIVLAGSLITGWNVFGHTTSFPPTATATADSSGVEDNLVRFLAFGDMGTGDKDQYALGKRMADWQKETQFDTVLMLGDNIYPDGDPADLPSKFERPYETLLQRNVKFYAVFGNHDIQKGREAQLRYPKFNMGGRSYYSFTKGKELVEFFGLDTTNFEETQMRWLEKSLANSTALWKLVYSHHSPYSSARKHGSDEQLRAKVEPLMVKYGVSAFFAGHDHVYERTKPQKGIQYFISGAASGKLRRGDLNRNSPFFAVGNDEVSSFLYVELTRDRLIFKAIDIAGVVFDSGMLPPIQPKGKSFQPLIPLAAPQPPGNGNLR